MLVGYDGVKNKKAAEKKYNEDYDYENPSKILLDWQEMYCSAGTLSGWKDKKNSTNTLYSKDMDSGSGCSGGPIYLTK